MQNFYYDIPTKVFFGEGQIQNLPELVSEFGQRALLVYGCLLYTSDAADD